MFRDQFPLPPEPTIRLAIFLGVLVAMALWEVGPPAPASAGKSRA